MLNESIAKDGTYYKLLHDTAFYTEDNSVHMFLYHNSLKMQLVHIDKDDGEK
jgi:hypothetical protein